MAMATTAINPFSFLSQLRFEKITIFGFAKKLYPNREHIANREYRNCRTVREVIIQLKEYECAEVGHHKDVGKVIEEWQRNGWRLHTYQAAGSAGAMTQFIMHYLLFEKGE